MGSSSFEGVVLGPSKCSKLTIKEKRELVYEQSKCSHGASEMLQSWSREEILQILCAEMGKERKCTGLTKLKIIENLLKIVSEKKQTVPEPQSLTSIGQRTLKRQRKTEHPSKFSLSVKDVSIDNRESDLGNTIYCKNSACRAKASRENEFCKRCSCCVCYKYDDNKDPSLWLTCSSETLNQGESSLDQGESCGMSCHLECALRHERSGIETDKRRSGLDGRFYCLSCGKVNDLLGCLRKQLVMAKDTRRVDILCYRVSLSKRLLGGTKHYPNLHVIVDEAIRKLEAEVGTLSGLPVKMARGIVNRLSMGPEVQKFCALAVESLDATLSSSVCHTSDNSVIQDFIFIPPNDIRFEDVYPSSLTVILGPQDPPSRNLVNHKLWHRKADDSDYPAEATCTSVAPNTRFPISGLSPSTDYIFRVISFDSTTNRELGVFEARVQTGSGGSNPKSLEVDRSQSPTTNCSSLSNPSSVEDESNAIAQCKNKVDSREDNYKTVSRGKFVYSDGQNVEKNQSPEGHTIEEMSTDDGSNTRVVETDVECITTPCKLENFKDGLGKIGRPKLSDKDLDKEDGPHAGSSSKKRRSVDNKREEEDLEYYVKVIRWLECEGHIETAFRQKFLTWYGLRATPQELRVVKVFVDTLIEDPESLAGQLVDTFAEAFSSKQSSAAPNNGFCLKLWH